MAYVGSKGNHLFMSNQLNPAIFGRPGNVNQRRLYAPFYGPVTNMSSQANSNYHAFQTTLNKRLTNGFTVLANYTFSKLIDDASSDGAGPANPFDIRNQRGVSDFNIAHRFVGSFIWQLPKLTNTNAFVKHALGGWEANGIVTLESGQWLSPMSGADRSASAVNNDRAGLVGDPSLSMSRSRGEQIAGYFNRAAFVPAAAGTFGNAGRNIIEGPGLANVDLGLFKNFAVTETHRLQVRGEFFNAFNRVNLGNPNMNASAAIFSQITGARAPRVVQVALKYMF